jgi:Fur family peroxide stress response transcriptional regulator
MQIHTDFRELCRSHGLAMTHQRQVIYDMLVVMPGHPSPEEVFDRVRKKLPSISLATVYKTIHTFIESGILREVSPHHGSLRVDDNIRPHHHLVCTTCKSITDVDDSVFEPLRFKHRLPQGFKFERFAVDILGLCPQCAAKADKRHKAQ